MGLATFGCFLQLIHPAATPCGTPTVHPSRFCMSPKQRPTIVIVEDERSLAAALTQQLSMAGFITQTFHKGSTALRFIEGNHVHLVLLDPTLPDLDGLTVLGRLRQAGSSLAVIFLSSQKAPSQAVKALEAGADDFISKPHHPEELVARIQAVLRRCETADDRRLTKNAN